MEPHVGPRRAGPLNLMRSRLFRLQPKELLFSRVVVIAAQSRGRLSAVTTLSPGPFFYFLGERGVFLSAPDCVTRDAEIAGRKTVTAFVASPPVNWRAVRQFLFFPLFLREFGIFGNQ